MMKAAASYEALIFDLDGTVFRGKSAIPGAVQAVNQLRTRFPCRFLSNNGERTSSSLAQRLRGLGFQVEAYEIISSADLVLGYLTEQGGTHHILALTSDALARALEAQGHRLVNDDTADIIVVGVDRSLTRERMVQG
ncbi:MAG: hypothetical protein WBC63_00635, partial [Candidatus Bipolaricaulia bacterium]